MTDTVSSTSPHFQAAADNDPAIGGTWETVEQAAVALGLSVRTVNRHISAQKLKSRLVDGRREVFVPGADQSPVSTESPASATDPITPPAPTSGGNTTSAEYIGAAETTHAVAHDVQSQRVNLDFETALAMADSKAELAVSAYQSLTRSIETQAHIARRMARVAWCTVGVLAIGVTFALVWTATRVTRAEADSQHIKQQADIDALRVKEMADEANRRAETREKQLADMQQKLSDAQEHAARAEGRAAVYEELQARQATSQPTSRPNLIERLTTAFGGGQ